MKHSFLSFSFLMLAFSAFAQTNDVVDIAISSKDHTTLVTAVKAADLVTTLKRKRSFYCICPYQCCLWEVAGRNSRVISKPNPKQRFRAFLRIRNLPVTWMQQQ